KGIIGTVTSLGASSAASGLLGKLFGGSSSSSSAAPAQSSAAPSRRDATPEQVLASLLLASRSFDELD
ncbi:hypothetical protein FA95DRAFT_1614415, partial [Auriscalpium vulgare]